MFELKPINEFEGCQVEPMSGEQTRMLIALMTVPMDELVKSSPELMSMFSVRVAQKRLEAAQVEVDDAVVLMLADWSSNVGDVVIFCHAVSHKYAACKSRITLREFVEIFPMGIPTSTSREKFWCNQKGRQHDIDVDNMLDQMVPSVWPSIVNH